MKLRYQTMIETINPLSVIYKALLRVHTVFVGPYLYKNHGLRYFFTHRRRQIISGLIVVFMGIGFAYSAFAIAKLLASLILRW